MVTIVTRQLKRLFSVEGRPAPRVIINSMNYSLITTLNYSDLQYIQHYSFGFKVVILHMKTEWTVQNNTCSDSVHFKRVCLWYRLAFRKLGQVLLDHCTDLWVFWIPLVGSSHRNTGAVLCGAKLQFAVQVDIAVLSGELEHVEREEVICSLSVSLHRHRPVNGVRTSARINRRWHRQHWRVIFRTTAESVWSFFSLVNDELVLQTPMRWWLVACPTGVGHQGHHVTVQPLCL